ncbi:MAG TPA: hypothetical protein G4O05_05770 [Caldilineae bacterium]|nr:hypothetical protein [Caldilineae bacterium]HIQ12537.1 hypothetical protein [Caldilineales bacterium]
MEAHILFAGDLDQGILYVSQVFLEAAMEEGWRAVRVSSSEQDGVIQCQVVISDDALARLQRAQPDVALLASCKAADLLEYSVKPDGLLIMNASQVRRPARRHDVDVVFAPTEPEDGDKEPVLASAILLGALIALTGWVSLDRVSRILQKSCKDEAICWAFRRGAAYVESIGRIADAQSNAVGVWH